METHNAKFNERNRLFYTKRIAKAVPDISEWDSVWLTNKSRNKFSQLKRLSNVKSSTYKISLVREAEQKFDNNDIIFRLTSPKTNVAYIISFGKTTSTETGDTNA